MRFREQSFQTPLCSVCRPSPPLDSAHEAAEGDLLSPKLRSGAPGSKDYQEFPLAASAPTSATAQRQLGHYSGRRGGGRVSLKAEMPTPSQQRRSGRWGPELFPTKGSSLFSPEGASGGAAGPEGGPQWSAGCEGEKPGGAAGRTREPHPRCDPGGACVLLTEGAGQTESRFSTRSTDHSKLNPWHFGAARG